MNYGTGTGTHKKSFKIWSHRKNLTLPEVEFFEIQYLFCQFKFFFYLCLKLGKQDLKPYPQLLWPGTDMHHWTRL